MAKKKTQGISAGALLTIGGAVAATAAGTLFLYGTKEGKKTRRKITALAFKVKGDVIEELEHMKEVSEQAYHNAIEKISRNYAGLKNIDQHELTSLSRELKGHWKNIKREIQQGMKKTAGTAQKTVHKKGVAQKR